MYADEYAMQLFNDWGVGNSTANNGMLLLMATQEDKAWLTVGQGISDTMTESVINSYFKKYFWDDFDKGDYETATSKMMQALFSWYAGYYGVNATEQIDDSGESISLPNSEAGYYRRSLWDWIYEHRTLIVIAVILIYWLIRNDRRRYRSYYASRGSAIPPYFFWYIFTGPHRGWRDPNHRSWYDDDHRGGRGGGSGFGGGGGFRGGGGGGFGGFGGGGHSGSGFGGGGFGGGGGGRR